MRLNEMSFTEGQPVDGYGPGFFRIGGELYHGPVLVSPDGPTDWAGLDDLAPLTALAARIDVLFIGTGAEIAPLPPRLRSELDANGVGVETMNSPAACRTYNVLLSEGRRIALAVLPV